MRHLTVLEIVGGFTLTWVLGTTAPVQRQDLEDHDRVSSSESSTAEALSTRLDEIATKANVENADPQTLTALAGARIALKRTKNSASTYLSDAEEDNPVAGSFLQRNDGDEHLDALTYTLEGIMEKARRSSAHPKTLEAIQKFQKGAPLFSSGSWDVATTEALEKMKAAIQSISAGSGTEHDKGYIVAPQTAEMESAVEHAAFDGLSLSVNDKLGSISNKASEDSANPKTLEAIHQIQTLYQKSKGSETKSADEHSASKQSSHTAVGDKLDHISQHAQTHFADGKTLDAIHKVQEAYHKATVKHVHGAQTTAAQSERNVAAAAERNAHHETLEQNMAISSKMDGIAKRAQKNNADSITLNAIERMQNALTAREATQQLSRKTEVLSKLDRISKSARQKAAHAKTLDAIKHIRDFLVTQ